MTVRRRQVAATFNGRGLAVMSAVVQHDEARVPWITAELEVSRPTDPAIVAALNPNTAPPLTVSSSPLTGDIDDGIMSETVLLDTIENTPEDTVRLVGYSHDVRLLEYHPSAVDSTLLSDYYQSNTRALVGYVLGRVHGSYVFVSAPGAGVDVPTTQELRVYDDAVNLIANGGFEGGVQGWATSQANATQSTGWKNTGIYSMAVVPNGNSVASYAEASVSLEAGTQYTLDGVLRLSGAQSGSLSNYARRIVVTGTVNGSAGTIIAQTAALPNTANAVLRVRQTFRTPAGSSDYTVRVYNGMSGTGTSSAVYADDLFMVQGNGLEADGSTLQSFDGNTTSTARYAYSWSGDQNNSQSLRTALIDRPRDALVWSPDESAMEFLLPILQSLSWRLIPAGIVNGIYRYYLVTNAWQGRTGAQARATWGDNVYDAAASRSRSDQLVDGKPMYADAVILVYRWTDRNGVQQTRIDSYAPAGYTLPYVQEYERAWPGAGRAQSLWKRLQARARRVPVTVALSSTVQAGAPIVIDTPQAGAVLLASVDSVRTDYIAGTMELVTKGAVEYPSNAWIAATDTWATAPTGSWATDL